MSICAERRAKLVSSMLDRGLDGALITHLVNVRYLTGFTGSNGAVLLEVDGGTLFLTDGRYQDQAAIEVPDIDRRITRRILAESAATMREGRWAVETHALSVDDHSLLVEEASADLVSLQRAVEQLREIKDESEVESLRAACALSCAALEDLLQGPLVGRSELEIARDLESRMFALGAESIAFDTIVAAGANSAIPHHGPTKKTLETGDLLKIDFGGRVDGYHADCTRTVVIGKADEWQREIHDAVRNAQTAGLDHLTSGRPVADSLAAVQRALSASGWLDAFTTGLGHGVGLEIHEDPFIAANHNGKLNCRTVMTMEPGIYLAGRGGVRIEDTVVVGAGAPKALTTTTKDLLELC